MDYSKYNLTGTERIRFYTIGYGALFLLVYLFYHSLILALVGGLLIIFFEKNYREYLLEKRKAFLLVQFKDLLYSLSSSIATGRSMSQSLIEGRENLGLIYDESTPMMKELTSITVTIVESRESEENALVDFARRSQLEDITNFVDVYLACRKTGGQMEAIINNASNIIMEKMAIQREIKAITAQKKFEGKVITLMPIAVVLGLNIFYPDYLEGLYTVVAGRIIMTLALAGIGLAYLMTVKLTNIEV